MTTRSEARAHYPQIGQLIGGAFETGGARARADILDPTTGDVLGQYPVATEADIDRFLSVYATLARKGRDAA